METITRRRLSRDTAATLAQVREQGAVAVLDRDQIGWTIVAGEVSPDPLAELVSTGLVQPPATPIPWEDEPTARVYTGAEIDALIADTKGDH